MIPCHFSVYTPQGTNGTNREGFLCQFWRRPRSSRRRRSHTRLNNCGTSSRAACLVSDRSELRRQLEVQSALHSSMSSGRKRRERFLIFSTNVLPPPFSHKYVQIPPPFGASEI